MTAGLCPKCGGPCAANELAAYGRHEDCHAATLRSFNRGVARNDPSRVSGRVMLAEGQRSKRERQS